MYITLTILLLALTAFAIYVLLAWLFPPLIRPFFWLIVHTLMRFRVYETKNVPKTGGALLVSNHVTYYDWLLLWVASPRRVRFVLWEGFYKNPLFRFMLSFARHRTIRVDNSRGRAHAVIESLDRIAEHLRQGELVVLFPEQTLTRNGQMLPFGRGLERVMKQLPDNIPIIPTHLDNLWGSIFSWHREKLLFKWPPEWRRRVAVYFGEPLPSHTSAYEVRLAVQQANAECGIRQSDSLLRPASQFIRRAARFKNLFRMLVVDTATGSNRIFTWSKLLVAVWCLSGWLKKRLPADRTIGIWLPTSLGSLLVNYALSFRGKVTVNLNYTTGIDALRSATRQAEIGTIITSKRFLTRMPIPEGLEANIIYLEDALKEIGSFEKLSKLVAVILLPGWLLDWLIATPTKHDDVLTILFSSGSTGEPKGVKLSQRNITSNVNSFVQTLNLRPTDKLLGTMPFFHTFGYLICLWAPTLAPMRAVHFPDPRQGQEVGELCAKHGCTIMLATATFLRLYLRRAKETDFQTMRLLVCGAEKLPVKLAEEFATKFGVVPLEGYGCTELSPVVSVNMPDVTVAGLTQIANVPGTVGQPIQGVVVRSFNPETFEPLAQGVEGVLGAKGPNVMLGYLNDPTRTASVIRDGWYMTGDRGIIEPNGFIRITGRLSRFAKIAGEMIPLERLDEEMHDILGRNDDRVLAIAALPDEKRGERIVVLHLADVKERLSEVFEKLRARGITNLWIPDIRNCYKVDDFPTLASGKLDLYKLDELAKSLG